MKDLEFEDTNPRGLSSENDSQELKKVENEKKQIKSAISGLNEKVIDSVSKQKKLDEKLEIIELEIQRLGEKLNEKQMNLQIPAKLPNMDDPLGESISLNTPDKKSLGFGKQLEALNEEVENIRQQMENNQNKVGELSMQINQINEIMRRTNDPENNCGEKEGRLGSNKQSGAGKREVRTPNKSNFDEFVAGLGDTRLREKGSERSGKWGAVTNGQGHGTREGSADKGGFDIPNIGSDHKNQRSSSKKGFDLRKNSFRISHSKLVKDSSNDLNDFNAF